MNTVHKISNITMVVRVLALTEGNRGTSPTIVVIVLRGLNLVCSEESTLIYGHFLEECDGFLSIVSGIWYRVRPRVPKASTAWIA